ELDRAVMADQQPPGQILDCHRLAVPIALDHQERLMLARCQTGRPRGLLAEIEEATDQIAKLSQRRVVGLGRSGLGHRTRILSRSSPLIARERRLPAMRSTACLA